MKTYRVYFIICILTAVLSFGIVYAQPVTLTIIHVNDTHSNLDPYGAGKFGGIARAASVIGNWKMAEPNPILLHAGDFMVGNLMFNTYFGVPELGILNSLGFDALVLGNHEFDPGPEDLAGILFSAGLDESFHILGANVINLGEVPLLQSIVKPYAVKDFGDVKVGIIGVTTPAANVQSNPAPVIISDDIVEKILENMFVLRNVEGADVVIVLSHLGLAYDMMIADYLSGIDAIIGGHSHTPIHELVYANGIPIVHAGEFYSYIGKLRLSFDGSSTTVIDYVTQQITDAIPEEPTVAGMVDLLKQGVTAKYIGVLGDPYDPIATAERYMHAEPLAFDILDTPIGNLVTSAMHAYEPDIDCALEPTGHIVGGGIFEGPVTSAELFRAFPYGYDESDGLGFRLATYYLTGAHIYGMLHVLLEFIHPEINDFEYVIQSAGLDYVIYITPDGFEIGEVYINGSPLNPAGVYKVASSDMVVNYMNMLFGLTPPGLVTHEISVFQVFKEYVEGMGVLDLTATGHNRAVDFTTPNGIVGYIAEKIQLLTEYGLLNSGQGNALTAKLENALKQISKGKTNAGSNQLGAFINQVNDFIGAGIISKEIGEFLIGLANRVLSSIGIETAQKSMDSFEAIADTPLRFALDQNYPNPFNPLTTIRYSLPIAEYVKLEVYNILGQGVGVLVDEMQKAGYYGVVFDAASLSTGTYFYRLEAGGMVEVRRLTVLK
jgi:5'-nucleotidase / UDP-sugar diphosphatase